MEPTIIASTLVSLLVPYLPKLLHVGEKIADGASEKIGETLVEGVGKIWQKLRGKADETPALKGAVGDLAAKPGDADLQAALRVQLKKLLESDQAFRKEMTELLSRPDIVTITQNVQGDGNIVSARDQHIGNITQNFGR